MINFISQPEENPSGPHEQISSGGLDKKIDTIRKELDGLNMAVYLGGMNGENAISEKDASDITQADWRIYDYSQRTEFLSSKEQEDINKIGQRLDELKKQYSKKVEDAQKAYENAEGISQERLEFLLDRGRVFANELLDASNFPGVMSKDEIDKIQDGKNKLSTYKEQMVDRRLPKKSIQFVFQIGFYLERLHKKYAKEIAQAKDSFDDIQ